MSAVLAMVTAGALMGAPAVAEPPAWEQTEETMPARLIEVGTWQFSATRLGPDGKPECYESWTFNADNTGLVVSGQQRVTTSWETETLKNLGQFVFVTNESTTDGPDCMGRAVDKNEYPYKTAAFQVIFFDGGARAMICTAGTQLKLPDGTISTLLDAEDCWGELVPMP
ncbi:hypothetical protein [Porphyrobacter sp. LM 6]|uniref:hypothetical protein n=1 Tax=Porphyrobacter sp. LM 6 TaxID=1896196 RepID=UPI000863BDD0|nr:hypothetical protein [Porphyrobacter sp. LM 6]AOL93415.1 hypothetical protein BG023_11461 [Porphyrobacter sp. LM 6]